MKTQIIQLEPSEDLISVHDKMSWSQARRILLLWPRTGQVLNRKIDINLVRRYAASLGAQLAFVTQDEQVRFNAQLVGIPVFASTKQAEETQWVHFASKEIIKKDFTARSHLLELKKKLLIPAATWQKLPIIMVICLGASVMALFVLGIFFLPSAVVSFSAQHENQVMVFDLVADPNASSINYATGSLPSSTREVVIEGHDTIPASGKAILPAGAAVGSLRFTNETDRTVTVPVHTFVTTSGTKPIRFVTTSQEAVKINPGDSADLPAQAVQQGLPGNVAAYELDTIEGALGQYLSVENPKTMTGGTEATVSSPTTQDLAQLRQNLLVDLLQRATRQIQQSLEKGDILLSPTLSVEEVMDDTAAPPVGEPGNELELNLRIKVKAQVVSGASLQSLITPIMDSYTPAGYRPSSSTLDTVMLKNPTIGENGKVSWTIRATRQVQAAIPNDQVVNQVKGKPVSLAIKQLSETLPLTGQPVIRRTPSWWPWMPFLAMRIQLSQAGIP